MKVFELFVQKIREEIRHEKKKKMDKFERIVCRLSSVDLWKLRRFDVNEEGGVRRMEHGRWSSLDLVG